jgi:chromosome segregation protein
MTGGFTSRSAGVIGRQKEIETLLAQAKRILEQRAGLDAQADDLKRELASLDAELDAIDAKKKTCMEDRIRCETQLSRLTHDLSLADEQRENAKRERETLTARIEEMRSRSDSSEELIRTLTAELDSLQQQLSDSSARREAATAQVTERSAALSEQNTALALLDRDLQQTVQEMERLTESRAAGEERRAEYDERIAGLNARIAEANDAIAALIEKRTAAHDETKRLESEIAQKTERRNDSERRCTELRAAEKEAAARRDDLYREVVRLGEQKSSAENEQAALVAKLYDEYELTRSDAEELAAPVEDVSAANARLSELRAKIKSLGSVNVGAIEEYKEVSARYEELSHQIADVEHSKNELTRMIGELTGQMCEIFSKKFNEIDQNFRRTFTELFEGGSASLSLTDPDNLLESGIEISVHPPGKLIKNLAALSGGEQSFVAIAIFFSILKVNPAPFCLMDEIEAALDDVNVAKFAAYLRRMTDHTQFIAITHRRGTMEEADVLYGVTMQEDGVSKLLRLSVSEIEKTLHTPNQQQEG